MHESSADPIDLPCAVDSHRRRFVPSTTMFALAALTVFAGIIRFTRISSPPLWYDEAMVFWRTCGSYGQMLNCLRTDGFGPLHYSLMWVISRFFKETPLVLRFVPALCGTLMVPAIYWLSKQLLSSKTSLLAAAFTACSAFHLFYSRDAKMYMEAWLLVTLNTACVMWWLREKTSTAWLCWIATGAAACGVHISSAIPVALSSLFLFTQHTMRWQQALLWFVGVVLIAAGPIVHYEKFNQWVLDVEEQGWKKSQLEWINAYNYGRSGPQLVRYLGSSMMMGWEWPRQDAINGFAVRHQEGRFTWPACLAATLMGLLIAAAFPWPRRWRGGADDSTPGSIAPPEKTEPQWRVALWLSFWIVLPVYGFYCRSIRGFWGPVEWWHWFETAFLATPMQHRWLFLFPGILLAGVIALAYRYRAVRPSVIHASLLLVVAIVLLGMCLGMQAAMTAMSKAADEAGKPWESLWVPRYIGFVWPAVVIAVAALLMRLPTRPVRYVAILFFLAVNLGVGSFRILGRTEPPVDLMAADSVYAADAAHHAINLSDIDSGKESPGGGNLFSGTGQYYVDMLSNVPTDPPAFRKAETLRKLSHRDRYWWITANNLPSETERIIVWNQYADNGIVPAEDPTELKGWHRQSDDRYAARDVWIWQDLSIYRRRVYIREK